MNNTETNALLSMVALGPDGPKKPPPVTVSTKTFTRPHPQIYVNLRMYAHYAC